MTVPTSSRPVSMGSNAERRSGVFTGEIAQGDSWRRFISAVGWLALSLFFALYATALGQEGRYSASALFAALSLGLGCLVALRVVPALARRSLLQRLKMEVDYELTREGVIYFAIIGLMAIASVNTGNNLLYVILAILLAGILMSGILSKVALSGLDLSLVFPEHIFANRPARAEVTIHNLKRVIPSYSLTVTWHKKRKKNSGRRAVAATPNPPGETLARPVYAPYLPARGSVRETVPLQFPRRGRYNQDNFQVSSKFPFSILRRRRTIRANHEILVLPSIEPTQDFRNHLPLIRGEIESARKGRGGDLYALRDYQEGDSARQVDWKATAKTQKLKVREFTREEETRLTILFDASVNSFSAQVAKRFERAINLCACLAWQACTESCFLQFFGGGLQTTMAPAAEIVYPVLEELATLEPQIMTTSGSETLFSWGDLNPESFPIVITQHSDNALLRSLPEAAHIIAMDRL